MQKKITSGSEFTLNTAMALLRQAYQAEDDYIIGLRKLQGKKESAYLPVAKGIMAGVPTQQEDALSRFTVVKARMLTLKQASIAIANERAEDEMVYEWESLSRSIRRVINSELGGYPDKNPKDTASTIKKRAQRNKVLVAQAEEEIKKANPKAAEDEVKTLVNEAVKVKKAETSKLAAQIRLETGLRDRFHKVGQELFTAMLGDTREAQKMFAATMVEVDRVRTKD